MSFNVKFSANGNILGSLTGNNEMLISELLMKFYQANGLNEKDKVTFTFQTNELKTTSCKNLKELGIISDSTIEVQSEKALNPFNNPENAGNSQVPQNNFPFMMNNNNFGMNGMMFNQNMAMNQNMNNYGMMNNQNMAMNSNMNYYGMMNNQNMAMNPNMNNFGMMYNQNMAMNPNMNNYGMMYNQNMAMNANMNNVQNNVNQNMAMNANMNNVQNNVNQNVNNQNANIQNNVNQNMAMNQNMNNVQNNMNQNMNNQNNNSVPFNSGGNSDFMNIVFNNQSQIINIQAKKTDKFCEIAKKYHNKAVLGERVPSFLYNSKKIEADEAKTLEQLDIKGNPKIDVIFNAEIIGA